MRAQLGSVFLPILMTPRINQVPVTVTQIKTIYSSKFVDNSTTPLDFYLEYADRTGAKTEIKWDSVKSSDSLIYFPVPDAVYATLAKYSVLFYWTVSDNSVPAVVIEKIFVEQPQVLEIEDQHTEI